MVEAVDAGKTFDEGDSLIRMRGWWCRCGRRRRRHGSGVREGGRLGFSRGRRRRRAGRWRCRCRSGGVGEAWRVRGGWARARARAWRQGSILGEVLAFGRSWCTCCGAERDESECWVRVCMEGTRLSNLS